MKQRISHGVEDLMDIVNDINRGVCPDRVFSKIQPNLSMMPLHEKYLYVNFLLDQLGSVLPRLSLISKIVKMPSFVYDKEHDSLQLLYTLACSSYWLDQELFDEKVVRQHSYDKMFTVEQQAHMALLDIGSIFIDKGFPLDYETFKPVLEKSKMPTVAWVKQFIKQSHERNLFLRQTKGMQPQSFENSCMFHSKRGRE